MGGSTWTSRTPAAPSRTGRSSSGRPYSLLQKGLRKTDFPVGSEVVVKGFRAKTGKAVANARSVTLPDGRNFYASAGDSPGAPVEVSDAMRLPALLLLLAVSSLSLARRTVRLAQERQSSIPRGADGKPDFSGIWQTLSAAEYDLEPHSTRKDAPPGPGIVEGQVIPYRPEALATAQEEFRRARDQRPAHEVLHARDAAWDLLAGALSNLPARTRPHAGVPVRPLGSHHPHQRYSSPEGADRLLAR